MSSNSHLLSFLPAVLIAAAVLLWGIWMMRRSRGGPTDASCGNCGYLVVGLTGPICPECGGNLSEVGIRLPSDVRPMPRRLRGVVFTLLYAAVVLLILPLIVPLLPRWYVGSSSLKLAYPPSQAYQSITTLASGAGFSPVVRFDHVDLTLAREHEQPRVLHIQIGAAGAVKLTNDDEQNISLRDIHDLTPELVLDWMTRFAGPDSPKLRAEAQAVSAETIKLASSELAVQQGYIYSTPFSSLNFRQFPAVPVMTWRVIGPLIGAIALIWIMGLAIVVRWGKRVRSRESVHA